MIRFNVAPQSGNELKYFTQVLQEGYFAGDGPFAIRCEKKLQELLGSERVFLTPSGTAALEMACMLAEIGPGDEMIVPSFTFSTSAASAVQFGGTPVFVDIRPDTMNIDETKIEAAITPRTKAIMVVHYAGVACEMDTIMEIAKRHHLLVIEDAAQAIDAYYKGKPLGTIGDFGCFSFHATKNIAMGEGGCIAINNPAYVKRAYHIRDSGTDAYDFENGLVSAYSWVDKGSSYLPSEFQCAYLYGQLEKLAEIQNQRLLSWEQYYHELETVKEITLPFIPDGCTHNAHMFYIKTSDNKTREDLRLFLKKQEIYAVFHYSPLHSSRAGKRFGCSVDDCPYTTSESARLLRLPMYYGLQKEEIHTVCEAIKAYYRGEEA